MFMIKGDLQSLFKLGSAAALPMRKKDDQLEKVFDYNSDPGVESDIE